MHRRIGKVCPTAGSCIFAAEGSLSRESTPCESNCYWDQKSKITLKYFEALLTRGSLSCNRRRLLGSGKVNSASAVALSLAPQCVSQTASSFTTSWTATAGVRISRETVQPRDLFPLKRSISSHRCRWTLQSVGYRMQGSMNGGVQSFELAVWPACSRSVFNLTRNICSAGEEIPLKFELQSPG